MWNLKYGTDEPIYGYRNTDTEKKLVVAKWEGFAGEMEWEPGVSRCKLLYIEWINTRSYCKAQRTIFHILR